VSSIKNALSSVNPRPLPRSTLYYRRNQVQAVFASGGWRGCILRSEGDSIELLAGSSRH
jgi:hypothetical protein